MNRKMQYNKNRKDNNPEGGVSMKTKKITAVVLSMVMLLTLLTGCGMNKEKAIEQMRS